MKIDIHMHTPFCGHALGEPEDFVEVAAEEGIELITFTCHIPLKPDHEFGGPRIRMEPEDLPDYHRAINRARMLGEELGVKVLTGIEAEIFPDEAAMQSVRETIRKEPFDFVLGSVHHQLPGYRFWLDRQGLRTDPQIIRAYFRHLIEGIESGLYDSISHPDVIRIYGTVSPFDPVAYKDEIVEVLETLQKHDHCMEVNTSGLIKGVFEVHPAPVILDWAVERNVRLTMGSDAHTPEQVGQHFDEVRYMLKEKGFDKLHYFEGRQRKEVPL
ncbi:MAG: histidinol-phosphatase [Verrucomicrobiota bacterium]